MSEFYVLSSLVGTLDVFVESADLYVVFVPGEASKLLTQAVAS